MTFTHLLTRPPFEQAGMATTYHLEYGGSSLYVHGTNVEHDFVDPADAGIQSKPFVQRDPEPTLSQLGRMTVALIALYRLIWEDRGRPEYQEPVKFEYDDGKTVPMHVLEALTARAISIFRSTTYSQPT